MNGIAAEMTDNPSEMEIVNLSNYISFVEPSLMQAGYVRKPKKYVSTLYMIDPKF